jgi:hypothetical protein
MVENIKIVRTNQHWYEKKNGIMLNILRILMTILLLLCIIYILGSKTIWSSQV